MLRSTETFQSFGVCCSFYIRLLFYQFISLFVSFNTHNIGRNQFSFLFISLILQLRHTVFKNWDILPSQSIYSFRFTTYALLPCVKNLLIPIEPPKSSFRQYNLEISCTEKHFSLHFIWHKEQLHWKMRCFSFLELFRRNYYIRNFTLITGISPNITATLHLTDMRKERIKKRPT